nr:uncharacterized protein LOC129154872 [Nothobranchius furzeri]
MEKLWPSMEGAHLHLKEETDATRFPFTVASIKSEDDKEKPLFSQLHQKQIEDRDVSTSSSADQTTAETGGLETSRNPDLYPHEQTPDYSETDIVDDDDDDDDDDDATLDSELSDSGSETGDRDKEWNENRILFKNARSCRSGPGQGTPWDSPGGAGPSGWGEGSLGLSTRLPPQPDSR